jgi:hypothetical protein
LLRAVLYYRTRAALLPRTVRALETELNSFRTLPAEMPYGDLRAARADREGDHRGGG